jgi:hypothetical protein
MKHTLIYFCLLINTITFGQNAIADLKFEEAEIAFNNGNYDLTLKKVAEYEKLKGNTTAKSLYLKVAALDKLFNPDNFYTDEKQLEIYNSLIVNTNKYLKAMENEGLDDKYREVYSISEKIKEFNLPKDKAGWQKGYKALEDQKRMEEERVKMELKKNHDYALSLALKYGYKPNITIQEYASLSPENKEMADKKGKEYSDGSVARSNMKLATIETGPFYLTTRKNLKGEDEVDYLQYIISKGSYYKRYDLYLQIVTEIEENINKEYIEKSYGGEGSPRYQATTVTIPELGFNIKLIMDQGTLEIYFDKD